SMIVEKAVKMAEAMNVPILGLVENMSYFECPDCGKRHEIYGQSHIEEIAGQYKLDVLGRIPIMPQLAAECDAGQIETVEANYLDEATAKLLALDE
ncbi:MAG: P-loop NTPase, partial [Butyrivibrio sp.]|nr:P-loop NTPase [Butyrivibrio sp.]